MSRVEFLAFWFSLLVVVGLWRERRLVRAGASARPRDETLR